MTPSEYANGGDMKIGLDFDETYTAQPELFDAFISMCKDLGIEVAFVTYRPSNGCNGDIEIASNRNGIEIVYTEGNQKSGCYGADIWIDDSPECIPSAKVMAGMVHGCLVNNDI